MAYPTVRDYSTGVITTQNIWEHEILLPASISAGDLIIVFITSHSKLLAYNVNDLTSSSNWHKYARYAESDLYNATILYPVDDTYPVCMTILMAYALGGGNDVLIVNSIYTFPSKIQENNNLYSMYAKPSYICYSISNVKFKANALAWPDGLMPVVRYNHYNTYGNNWNMPALYSSGVDDYDYEDYLWFLCFGATSNNIVITAPSGWSGLVTAQGSALVNDSTSVSVCNITTTGVSNINPGATNASSAYWLGSLIKVYPATGGDASEIVTDPSIGVGTYIYREEAYKYIPDIDSIVVLDSNLIFDYDKTVIDSRFDDELQVISSGSWTAYWGSGLYFTAFQYSGDAGVTYVPVHCVDNNTSGSSYEDTLYFECGTANTSVTFEQYSS